MILFFAPAPTIENERDGLIQRVIAIDNAFKDVERRILDVSFTAHRKRRVIQQDSLLQIEYVNAIVHLFYILYLAFRSRAIYVHHCSRAFRVLYLYLLFGKVITDLHGITPEETLMAGMRSTAERYRYIERIVVRRSAALVCVTRAMQRHFEVKYPGTKATFFVVPNLPVLDPACPPERARDLAIYCGGAQAWQCIDEMMQAASETSDSKRFLFLTGDVNTMKTKAEQHGVAAEIASAAKSQLPAYYARATFGFVLREDNAVNRVACPTKLMEYIYYGVIPILKTPNVGDFAELGLQYVPVESFVQGESFSDFDLEQMRQVNCSILSRLQEAKSSGLDQLREYALKG